MSFYLGKASRRNLEGVHPDLVRVIERAIQLTPTDFGVTEGLRAPERQAELVQAGKSTTYHSKHLPQPDGYSHAVDLYVRDSQGQVTWKHEWFRPVIQAVMTAAIEEGVQIRVGALWRTFLDSPHIELNEAYYP